jgi:hypothetical protein
VWGLASSFLRTVWIGNSIQGSGCGAWRLAFGGWSDRKFAYLKMVEWSFSTVRLDTMRGSKPGDLGIRCCGGSSVPCRWAIGFSFLVSLSLL